MLKAGNTVTNAMMTTSGNFTSFKADQKPLLREANLFLSNYRTSSSGCDFQTGFSKCDLAEKRDRVSIETFLVGIMVV